VRRARPTEAAHPADDCLSDFLAKPRQLPFIPVDMVVPMGAIAVFAMLLTAHFKPKHG